jgi:predicted enzyme related to lactoylglutathione lyase
MSQHSIVHVEIPAQDPEASHAFYSNLFGWKHEYYPNLNYHRFYTEEGPGGGYVSVGDQAGHKINQVRISVLTDDIESTLAKVEELGGQTVTPKTEIPDMGWFAVFKDPQGNLIGLFTY